MVIQEPGEYEAEEFVSNGEQLYKVPINQQGNFVAEVDLKTLEIIKSDKMKIKRFMEAMSDMLDFLNADFTKRLEI